MRSRHTGSPAEPILGDDGSNGTRRPHTPMRPLTTQFRGSWRLFHPRGERSPRSSSFRPTRQVHWPQGERRRRCPIRVTRGSFMAATRSVRTTTSLTVHATNPNSSRRPSARTRRLSAHRRRPSRALRNATRLPHSADPATRRKAANGLPHANPGIPPVRSMPQAPGEGWAGPSGAAPP